MVRVLLAWQRGNVATGDISRRQRWGHLSKADKMRKLKIILEGIWIWATYYVYYFFLRLQIEILARKHVDFTKHRDIMRYHHQTNVIDQLKMWTLKNNMVIFVNPKMKPLGRSQRAVDFSMGLAIQMGPSSTNMGNHEDIRGYTTRGAPVYESVQLVQITPISLWFMVPITIV